MIMITSYSYESQDILQVALKKLQGEKVAVYKTFLNLALPLNAVGY
jgi:hypothetical protein